MAQSSKKMAAVQALAAGSVALLALTGCSNGGDNGGAGGEGGAAAEQTIRLAHVYEATHPVETCGVSTLQSELEGSGITVESFPAAQLGSEAESLEQLATGSLDIAVAGASFLGNWHEPASVLDAGYLFDDVDHFKKTIKGEPMQTVFNDLASASGMRVHSGWYYGTRHVTSNKPISKVGDLAGVKIRVPDSPIYLQNIDLMGGTATPMALSEVYLGLQQGVIDAQENPIPTIQTAKFTEVQDYINLTGHVVQGVYLISQDSMTANWGDEQKSAFASALDKAETAVNQCIIDDEESVIKEWVDGGVIEVNDSVDREGFAAEAQAEFAKNPVWGDLYTEIRNNK